MYPATALMGLVHGGGVHPSTAVFDAAGVKDVPVHIVVVEVDVPPIVMVGLEPVYPLVVSQPTVHWVLPGIVTPVFVQSIVLLLPSVYVNVYPITAVRAGHCVQPVKEAGSGLGLGPLAAEIHFTTTGTEDGPYPLAHETEAVLSTATATVAGEEYEEIW